MRWRMDRCYIPAVPDRDPLRTWLRDFTPHDEVEAHHLQRCVDLLAAPGDPFARDHWDPGHFTASAFILSAAGDQLLLIFHGKLHRWLQPGGHVDPTDADVEAAARREALEEVGLDVLERVGPGLFDVDVHEIPARKQDPAHAHFDLRFLFRAPAGAIARAGSDARGAQWVPLGEVTTLESDESVLRAVRKLRAR